MRSSAKRPLDLQAGGRWVLCKIWACLFFSRPDPQNGWRSVFGFPLKLSEGGVPAEKAHSHMQPADVATRWGRLDGIDAEAKVLRGSSVVHAPRPVLWWL